MQPNRYTIRCPDAELRWGYRQVAVLKGCELTITAERSDLTATVTSQEWWASDAALKFQVLRPTTAPWKWPVVSMDISGQTLTATLGPQE